MSRPYVSKSIVELEALFAAGKSDPNELKRLHEELSHRHVPKAVKLFARVKSALTPGHEPTKQNKTVDRPYMSKSIVELEALFMAGTTDRDELNRLSEELTHRHVPKAVDLLARVKKAIDACKAEQEPPKQGQSTRNTEKPAASSEEPPHVSTSCKVCSQKLRVPRITGTFTCPACKTEFRATFEDGVFALVFAHPAKENPQAKSPNHEPVTLDDAYALFEANDGTSWEAIECKRRKLLQQYHPDKVASLGPKLRALAEVEGKRINVAYALIREARGY